MGFALSCLLVLTLGCFLVLFLSKSAARILDANVGYCEYRRGYDPEFEKQVEAVLRGVRRLKWKVRTYLVPQMPMDGSDSHPLLYSGTN